MSVEMKRYWDPDDGESIEYTCRGKHYLNKDEFRALFLNNDDFRVLFFPHGVEVVEVPALHPYRQRFCAGSTIIATYERSTEKPAECAISFERESPVFQKPVHPRSLEKRIETFKRLLC